MAQRAITAITPTQPNPDRAVVAVNNRPVATLGQSVIAQLGLQVGQAWEPALAEKVAEAVTLDKAVNRAAGAISRRVLSRAETTRKLEQLGYWPVIRDRALTRLAELGLIDDEKLGRLLIEETLAKKPAGAALLRQKLVRRGLEEGLIERLLQEVTANPADLTVQALRLARERLAALAGLDALSRKRRVWGLLARRGFDEDTIQRVMEEIGEG